MLGLCLASLDPGVGYDLPRLRLAIIDKRKIALTAEIKHILSVDSLSPGAAGKLKGKLTFAAGQLWGRKGRHLMPALSHRQYRRKSTAKSHSDRLDSVLQRSLREWQKILRTGKTRLIMAYASGRNDVTLFTDGWVPDKRKGETAPRGICGRIGAVLFHKSLPKPLCFAFDVPESWAWAWQERDTQIILVELIAPLLASYTWRMFLKGRSTILFNDSTTAESILIKGYSNQALDANKITAEYHDDSCEQETCVYIERCPTDCNPSDGCSRGKILEDALRFGWEICRVELKEDWIKHGPGHGY